MICKMSTNLKMTKSEKNCPNYNQVYPDLQSCHYDFGYHFEHLLPKCYIIKVDFLIEIHTKFGLIHFEYFIINMTWHMIGLKKCLYWVHNFQGEKKFTKKCIHPTCDLYLLLYVYIITANKVYSDVYVYCKY